jgi:hypothetical protein
MPHAFITLIENKGMDIGGFLNNINCLFKNVDYKQIDAFYIFHTKTIEEWRNNIYLPILFNYKTIEDDIINVKKPIMYGAEKCCYPNNKLTNRTYIREIYDRYIKKFDNYFSEQTYNSFFDDYYDYAHFNAVPVTNNCLSYYEPNFNFYKFYERDLSTDTDVSLHYKTCGRHEYHRITNPYYIKNFGKESYFLAGTMFVCNNLYIEILKNIDFDYEFSILETGYVINTIPRKIHSWEYFFGLLVYYAKGYIKAIMPNGKIKKMKKLQKKFDVDIYQNSNPDLKFKNKNDYANHYNTVGKIQNRICSLETLMKKQCVRNCDISKAQIAFLLSIPTTYNKDTLILLLTEIDKLMMEKNIYVDFYFANNKNEINKYLGLSIVNESIDEIFSYIKELNVLNDINKINFYLGLELAKKYQVLFTPNKTFAENFIFYKNKCTKCLFISDLISLQDKM